MASSEYADSAQAREVDAGYQRDQVQPNAGGSESFWAECEARNKAERVASAARVKVAVDGIGVILGYRK